MDFLKRILKKNFPLIFGGVLISGVVAFILFLAMKQKPHSPVKTVGVEHRKGKENQKNNPEKGNLQEIKRSLAELEGNNTVKVEKKKTVKQEKNKPVKQEKNEAVKREKKEIVKPSYVAKRESNKTDYGYRYGNYGNYGNYEYRYEEREYRPATRTVRKTGKTVEMDWDRLILKVGGETLTPERVK